MKKIAMLFIALSFLLMGCESVSRHYEKNSLGSVVVTTTHEDGSTTIDTYNDPKVKSLKRLGLSENQAVNLVANGAVAESSSSTPSTLGWILIVVLVILIIVIGAASGDGFFTGMLVADLLDD